MFLNTTCENVLVEKKWSYLCRYQSTWNTGVPNWVDLFLTELLEYYSDNDVASRTNTKLKLEKSGTTKQNHHKVYQFDKKGVYSFLEK